MQAMWIMRGTLAGRDALLFDYRHTTGGGKSQHLHRQTSTAAPARAGRWIPRAPTAMTRWATVWITAAAIRRAAR